MGQRQTHSPKEITRLLVAWGEGDASALEQLTRWSMRSRIVSRFYWDEAANPPVGVMILPFAGGRPVKRLSILPDAINGFALHWSPDGRAILHFDESLANLWSQPIDGVSLLS